MTRRWKAISPVPLGLADRRDRRAFWQRCTCGFGTPCADGLAAVTPLPFPARSDRAPLPISPPASVITGPDRALPFAATNGNASEPRPLTPDDITRFHTAHRGITATSTPPVSRKNTVSVRRSTTRSGVDRSFAPSFVLQPIGLPFGPAGGRGRHGRTASTAGPSFTRAKAGSAPAAKPDDPPGTRLGNEGGSTVRSSHHQAVATGVSPPAKHGVAGGRPQMAYRHINLGRR